MTDYNMYKLEEGRPAHTAVVQFVEDRKAVTDKWYAFAEKFSTEEIYAGDSVAGLILQPGKVPEGWKTNNRLPKDGYKPTRNKACREAYREFLALPTRPSGIDLSNRLKVGPVMDKGSLHFPGFEKVADTLVLKLHPDSDVPEGVMYLKKSDYWKLKEEFDAK